VRILVSFILLLLVWLALTGSLDPQQVVAGVVLAVLFSLVVSRLYRGGMARILNPVRWFWFLVYVVYFLYHCFRANLDVAYRALHPDMPIRPGIIKVRTSLTTDLAKTFLANSITLTPGTLTVDIKNDRLFVHWINISTDDPAEQTRIIVRRFEEVLRRIFE